MALAVGYDASGLRELFSFDFSKIDDRGGAFGLGVVVNYFHHGITRGKALTSWIESILDNAPVKKDGRAPARFGDLDGRLQVIGADIVHSRMVVFPQDVTHYVDQDGKPFVPDEFPIATAVRISAGYPGFFPPIALRDSVTGKDGALVDGGVTSGFPVFLFDQPNPKRATWAFRLYDGAPPERPPYHPISGLLWPVDMISDVIDTAINSLDDFELETFGNRVIAIPTGNISALDFKLTDAQKRELYDFGYRAGTEFFRAPDPTNRFGQKPA
jgi:NTE family protein